MFARQSRLPLRRTRKQRSNGPAFIRTWRLVLSVASIAIASACIAFASLAQSPAVDHLVISQLYAGGGNPGAVLTHDYVEIYNPTATTQNLAGWTVQFAGSASTSWTMQPLTGPIGPGEYLLVQLRSSGAIGSPLPVIPNISGDAIDLGQSSGKLALVSNAIALAGSCPNGNDPDIVDFVGYGPSATCFEATRAPAASNTTALFRRLDGAQDTNQNGNDFQSGAPNPRRTAPIPEPAPAVTATYPTVNGQNVPRDATISIDFTEPVAVAGNWFNINCTASGQHNNATFAAYDNARGFHITPNTNFQFGEHCTVTLNHTNVHDLDLDDSFPGTDTMALDHSWTFIVVSPGNAAPELPNVHLTMGNPSGAVADPLQAGNFLMEKPSFSLSYNSDKGTPNWVSWHLDNNWIGSLPNVETFRADPAVSPDWYRVQATDYVASGFDRGHMTPITDRDNEGSRPRHQETYLMSNVVPQAPGNNQGPWAGLETFLRSLLPANEVYIVAGPAGVGGEGDNGPATTIAGGHITVPAYTWKVALVLPTGVDDISRVSAATRTIAVIIPNQNAVNSDWQAYLTTVDAVEALTGYDFFANVPDLIETSIEAGIDGNNPPATENQFAATAEDVAGEIVLNAVSPNPTFTYTIVNGPDNGTLSGSGPAFIYTPAEQFNGSDSFTFRVNDGNRDSNVSTVNITVTEVNDAPLANSQAVSTNSNTPVGITLTGDDVETTAGSLVFEVTANPAHGTLSGSGANLTYTPNTNYSGPDSFAFTVRDTGDGSAPALTSAAATVAITVNDTVAPTLNAPTNVTVNTGAGATSCGAVVTDAQLGTATANDNAGAVSLERNGVPSGNVFPVGTTTITYTATDDAGNSTSATQTVTVSDNTAPTLTAPAPTSASADSSGHATVPDVVALTTAGDNCGPVTVTQSPLAGTQVGTGTHTITITATDAAGNTQTTTTTFTVNGGGGFTFNLSISPDTVKRGKLAKLDIGFANTSTQRLSVSFDVRYTSPCGGFVLDNVGPFWINAGANKNANVQFHVPKSACLGPYSFSVESFVNGVSVGTATANLTVVDYK